MRTLHSYKSGTVGKKRNLAVFLWYKLKTIGESVSVHEIRQISSLFLVKKVALLRETGQNDPWAKRLVSHVPLAVSALREQRNQVWNDASVNLVEGFCVSSFSSRVLAVGT